MAAEQHSVFYAEILRRLRGVRSRESRLDLLYGAMASVFLILALLLVMILAGELVPLNVWERTLLAAVSIAGIAAAIAWFIVRPLLRLSGILKTDTNETTALKVGGHFPGIRDRLLDALQIYEGRDRLRSNYSVDLIDASFADLCRQIEPLRFTDAVGDARVRKARKFVAMAFAVFLLLFVISPSGFLGSFHRLVHYNESFAASLPVEIVVEPGNAEVVRGQSISIAIRTMGKPVESLSLLTRQKGQVDFDLQTLKPQQSGVFRTELRDLKTSTEYFAAVEDVKSDRFMISVLDRPLIRSVQLRVTPPPYTRLPAKILDENIGDFSAYPGSRVSLRLTSSKDLDSAAAAFSDRSFVRLAAAGMGATGTFGVLQSKSYHLILRDKNGLTNIDPIEYTIKIIPDEYPTAEILSPAKNLDLTEEMKLDISVRIKDDFGFSKLRLAYRLAQSRYEKPPDEFSYAEIPLPQKTQGSADLIYHWDLAPQHLVPEDAVAYYVEVFDNDAVNGPKSGRSETYLVRLPSLEEVLSDVSQSHEESMESMQSMASETEQLKRDMEDLQRDMKKNRDHTDWQQQKKAEEMLRRYEAMKKKIDDLSQKLDEAVKKMDDNKLLSNQTLEKYQELQKLMDQLKSPELQEALKKLQESMKQLSPQEMKSAMEKMKLSEEQFRQNLERTIELLKRIHIEQKIDEIIKRAEELQKQQGDLKQQGSQSKSPDAQQRQELAEKQKDLQKQAESMEKETSDLQKKMEEFPKEMPLEQMNQAKSNLDQKKIGNRMQKSAQQMQSGNMQDAEKNQEQTEQDLSDFQQQMKDVQDALQDKQMKQIVNEMRKQLQNVLELSKREEALKDETRSLDPNSQQFREGAQKQNDTRNDLGNVADKMAELGKKTFAVSPEMGRELGNALNSMESAQENMEGRNPGGSSEKQNEAMGSLNKAAMMMQNALNGMGAGQGGMGMAGLMSRLGQMMGAQAGINQGTQNAMGQGEGQGMSAQQQAEYQRLAGAQGSVQKSLQELNEEAKNAGEFSKLLGDLDKVAEEMKEVQTDLEQDNVNPNTVRKQEHILSRLLDSQRSMRERDYEKRRRAETGNNVVRSSPADIDLSSQEGKNRLREELLKVLEGKYSKDYEALIRKYFDQLESAQPDHH